MGWFLFRWTWELKALLHVGLPPAGALNRTRLYIPSRALWGALTAELARRHFPNQMPNYQGVGEELQEKTRLTYLYPAEREKDRWSAWLPLYRDGDGLSWVQESDPEDKGLPNRVFYRRLLQSCRGTAIEPGAGVAEGGTLRETNLIQPIWRDEKGNRQEPVAFVGYIFIQSDNPIGKDLEKIRELFIGGDTRYGLGRMRRVGWQSATEVFGRSVDLEGDDPVVETDLFLSHVEITEMTTYVKGSYECLVGWDYAKVGGLTYPFAGLLWAPGSRSRDLQKMAIQSSGIWRVE